MVIEAACSAITLLDPMAQEIQEMNEVGVRQNAYYMQKGSILKNVTSAPNVGGPRYQFKMDRRVLSPVHLAAITRIYGDHGAEILELLRKNPVKTIPILLARLRQKEMEWRVARERLNKLWANVQRGTYYKSLDRRSADLKNEDKKGHSSKALVAAIGQK
ncbi:unnamed protein product [Laminaria digitata]